MKYSNPLPPEGINTSTTHPLKEFAILTGGFLAVIAAAILILILLAERLAVYIPFETEITIAGRFMDELESTETGPVAEYLQQLADQLAAAQNLPRAMKITVHFHDADTVNAMATLGGNIVVFRGLLEKMGSENELAMVLSHEIAHIKHRHPVRSLGRGMVIALAVATMDASLGSGMASQALGGAGLLTLMKFSREQEEEADLTGLEAVASVYGHIAGAEDLFRTFMALPGSNSGRYPDFLSTHPLHDHRIELIHQFAAARHLALDAQKTVLPNIIRELKDDGKHHDPQPRQRRVNESSHPDYPAA
ncbi:MAG: M48 family metallopeptidase [Mariprofundaceae bacterium]